MAIPIRDYVVLKIGRTWTQEDADYVIHVVAEIEKTATGVRELARKHGQALGQALESRVAAAMTGGIYGRK